MVHCSGTGDTIDNRGVIMWCLVIIIVMGIHFPASSYFNLYRACQAYERNDVNGARELFGATAACDTKNWKALFNLGTIALNEQEYEDAIKYFDKVLEIRPDCKEANRRSACV